MLTSAHFALALALLAAAPAFPVLAGPELQRARSAYEALDFEQCLRSLHRAARQYRDAKELAQVELYRGLCSAESDDASVMLGHFRLGLELDPALELPALASPKLAGLFQAARESVERARAEAAARAGASTAGATGLAGPDRGPAAAAYLPDPSLTGTREPSRARWGVYLSSGAAVVAGGLGVLWGVQARTAEGAANGTLYADEAQRQGEVARGHALRANVAFGVAAVAAAGAIVFGVLAFNAPPGATAP